jgi:DMSO/TMAO reductase YedYZ molybdopterin-dependent catalytic subunit
MTRRRSLLQAAAGGLLLAGANRFAPLAAAELPAGTIESERLETLPGKQPLLKRSFRPPNYESPLSYLSEAMTPNERFFVRWHLANIPVIDVASWRLAIDGDGAERPFDLTMERLREEFDPVELVAVCQCAGNRRGLTDPHVPGVEWGNGAVGNARWKGVRLKDILARAGLRREAVEVAFNGADGPVLEATPNFVKSLPISKALEENTLVAYEMNGAPLPHWNGFPARLIVPGWAGTYWVKQVVSIGALTQPLKNFWMTTAYRLPKGRYPSVDRFLSQESETTTPITEIDVTSVITNISEGSRFRVGTPILVKGIAWDPGFGISRVEVSVDEGGTWRAAQLGADLGRFSFRTWQFAFTARSKGAATVSSRAINARGMTQTETWIANPAGYHNNVIERIGIQIA